MCGFFLSDNFPAVQEALYENDTGTRWGEDILGELLEKKQAITISLFCDIETVRVFNVRLSVLNKIYFYNCRFILLI